MPGRDKTISPNFGAVVENRTGRRPTRFGKKTIYTGERLQHQGGFAFSTTIGAAIEQETREENAASLTKEGRRLGPSYFKA
jgi:hypothetical protein